MQRKDIHFQITIGVSTMTTPKPVQGNSDFTTFNIRHGFPEALVRGMRSSFLADSDYNHLIQCETLDDVRLNLTETDYADSIADFNSITPAMLQKAAVEKVGNSNDVIFFQNYFTCNGLCSSSRTTLDDSFLPFFGASFTTSAR